MVIFSRYWNIGSNFSKQELIQETQYSSLFNTEERHCIKLLYIWVQAFFWEFIQESWFTFLNVFFLNLVFSPRLFLLEKNITWGILESNFFGAQFFQQFKNLVFTESESFWNFEVIFFGPFSRIQTFLFLQNFWIWIFSKTSLGEFCNLDFSENLDFFGSLSFAGIEYSWIASFLVLKYSLNHKNKQ